MPVKVSNSKIILGILFALLLLIVVAFLVSQKDWIRQRPQAIASLRRSIKEHEMGIYNGIYGGVGIGLPSGARTR